MLCENCGLRPATTKIEQIIGGEKKTLRLCNACAEEQAFFGPNIFDAFFGDSFFDSFFGPARKKTPRSQERMDILDYFSSRAKEALGQATNYAKQYKSEFIDTEHLLLALCDDKELIPKIFKKIGLDGKNLKNLIEQNIKTGLTKTEPDVSPRAKRVFELAFDEAVELGHHYVGSEHLLLALASEGEGIASQILEENGADYNKIKNAIIDQIGRGETKLKPRKSKTPILDSFSRDLTALAKEGKIDPVIGRADEISRVIQILSRRTKNNPVLIGEPGVGKTAIAEGLANRIATNNVPAPLRNKRVIALDLSGLLAGTRYRGDFEERMKSILEEIKKEAGNIVLFIDEIHTLVGAGAAEGAIDASNMLKPSLARGELKAIGATTLKEYQKYIEKDAALERRFQPVFVDEPTVEETIEILQGLRDRYEAHHRVKITDDALVAAAVLSHRYITDRFLPDKAIDLIDEAAAKVRLLTVSTPGELKELEKKLKKLESEKEASAKSQDFNRAASLRDQINKLATRKNELESQWKKTKGVSADTVTKETVEEIISKWTGIPLTKISEKETEKLLNLEKNIHQKLVGQDEAVDAISEAIRRGRAGLKQPNRPIGSFIFLGPTGVGKTYLTKILAELLFGDMDAVIRLDMSEYMEKHNVSRLIGAPPGYVGYEEGGQLTEAIRRRPYSVILLDEIEKAHPDVFNILLQILDEGRLTDAKGRTVDFKNTLIIATSNVGAYKIFETAKYKKDYEKLKNELIEDLQKTFRPEFLNRIDEIIVFKTLTKEQMEEIVELMLGETKQLLAGQNIKLKISKRAKEILAERGYDPSFGARPLRRLIQKEIENPLSSALLRGDFKEKDIIVIDFKDGKFIFEKNASQINVSD